MIRVECDICKKELTQTGALLFSPPKNNMVRKYHICRKCFIGVEATIDGQRSFKPTIRVGAVPTGSTKFHAG